MLRIREIDHLVLRVKDVEAMVRFYGEVLGCPVHRVDEKIRLVQLRAGRGLIDLVPVDSELAFAVPQVVAHRLTRMALAGPVLSARDRREFHGMGQEKVHAFWQSWFAMGWAWGEAMQLATVAMLQGARVPMVDAPRILAKG